MKIWKKSRKKFKAQKKITLEKLYIIRCEMECLPQFFEPHALKEVNQLIRIRGGHK